MRNVSQPRSWARLGTLAVITSALLATLVLAPAFILPAAVASSNSSDAEGFSLSSDGQHYSQNPSKLFDASEPLTPGKSQSATLWIRNDRDHDIEVTVEFISPEAAPGVELTTTTDPVLRLKPQATAAVGLQVALVEEATNASADLHLDQLTVRVHARQTIDEKGTGSEVVPTPGTPQTPHPEQLGTTGFDGVLIPLALGILGAGSILWVASRYRKHQSTPAKGIHR